MGNLTSKTSNGTGTSFSYNAADELTNATGGMTRSYSYDGTGDLISSSDGTTIAHNSAGQITSITPPKSSAIPYTYTGIGETMRIGNGSTSYQYDGLGLAKQTDSLGNTYFTCLPDGTLLSETVPSGSYAGTYYYLSDGLGSVGVLTNSSGGVSNSYAYDPLGNLIAADSFGSVPNPFTFLGMAFDSHTGFYYSGSGYYDPATGQSFGCQDKGRADPGEDNCGEDENPACGGVCGGSSTGGSSGTFATDEVSSAGLGLQSIGCTLSTRSERTSSTRLYGQSRLSCKTQFYFATISTSFFYVSGGHGLRLDFIPCNYDAGSGHGKTIFVCPAGRGLAVDLERSGRYVYYSCAVVILDMALPGRPRSGFGCTGFVYLHR